MNQGLSQVVYADLRGKIESGLYKKGERLPDENRLSQSYGVGRQAVRQAIKQLAVEGIVRRIKGRGTFVVIEPKRILLGFVNSSWQLRLIKGSLSNNHKCETGLFDSETPLAVFEMLWLQEEKIVCFEKCCVDPVVCPNVLRLLNQRELTQHPVDFLSVYNKISVVSEKIMAEELSKTACKVLQVQEHTISLKRTLVFSDHSGKITAVSFLHYHPKMAIEKAHHI